MERLISMTDFVLEFGKETNRDNYEQAYDKISNYANFLKQPLTLGMFVACDLDGNVLKSYIKDGFEHFDGISPQEYQEAKDRVLFDGFEYFENFENLKILHYDGSKSITIEYLLSLNMEKLVCFDLVLTESARKHLGL